MTLPLTGAGSSLPTDSSPPAAAAHYRFDGDLTDASTNARTLSGTVTYAAGKFGQALADGTAGRANTLLSGSPYTGTYSISAWFYLLTSAGQQTVTFYSDALAPLVRLIFQAGNSVVRAARVEWAGGTPFLAATPLTASAWHHAAVVVSGGTGTLYADGVAVGSADLSGLAAASFGTAANTFVVAFEDGANRGLVDDLAVTPAALSAAEVASLWNGGAGNTYP